MPSYQPAPLPPSSAKPLLQVADSLCLLKPWETFHDVNLIGTRNDQGELAVSSILGRLGKVFGVITYRHNTGLRALYVTIHSGAFQLENLDYLKLEWSPKGALEPHDLLTLKMAGYKPARKGSVWPRFESASPGVVRTTLNTSEAKELLQILRNVQRLVELRQTKPDLYGCAKETLIAVVPAGDQSLKPTEIEWVPFEKPTESDPDPIAFSDAELKELLAVPQYPGSYLECVVALTPELAYMPSFRSRPVIPWLGLVVAPNGALASSGPVPGTAPKQTALKATLLQAFKQTKGRPAFLLFSDPTLFKLAQAPCQILGIQAKLVPQTSSADAALLDIVRMAGAQR